MSRNVPDTHDTHAEVAHRTESTESGEDSHERLPLYVNNIDTIMRILRAAEQKGCDVVLVRPRRQGAPCSTETLVVPLYTLVKEVDSAAKEVAGRHRTDSKIRRDV